MCAWGSTNFPPHTETYGGGEDIGGARKEEATLWHEQARSSICLIISSAVFWIVDGILFYSLKFHKKLVRLCSIVSSFPLTGSNFVAVCAMIIRPVIHAKWAIKGGPWVLLTQFLTQLNGTLHTREVGKQLIPLFSIVTTSQVVCKEIDSLSVCDNQF
jgi:hypothetical protein